MSDTEETPEVAPQREDDVPSDLMSALKEVLKRARAHDFFSWMADGFVRVAVSAKGSYPPLPHSHFLKAVKWSPDGTTFLTNSEDHRLRAFSLPLPLYGAAEDSAEDLRSTADPAVLQSTVQVKESDCIYDFAWYPDAGDGGPNCFACTACDAPIHLWDMETASIRATYSAHGYADEVIAAYSIAFTADGASRIIAGYKDHVRVFDIECPGRDAQVINVKGSKTARQVGGIISSVACQPETSLYAAGSFNSKVGVYDLRHRNNPVAMLTAHTGGITQVQFAPLGPLLVTGARREDALYCWDARRWSTPLHRLERRCRNNQKVLFDIDWLGAHVYTGCQSGTVKVYEVQRSGALVAEFPTGAAAVNCVALHPRLPIAATSSGERVLGVVQPPSSESDTDTDTSDSSSSAWSSIPSVSTQSHVTEGCVELWRGLVIQEHYRRAVEAGNAQNESEVPDAKAPVCGLPAKSAVDSVAIDSVKPETTQFQPGPVAEIVGAHSSSPPVLPRDVQHPSEPETPDASPSIETFASAVAPAPLQPCDSPPDPDCGEPAAKRARMAEPEEPIP